MIIVCNIINQIYNFFFVYIEFKLKMPRIRDPLWEYVEQEDGKVRCKFCDKTFSGSGITRMRHHLAKSKLKEISPCDAVPDVVHEKALKAVQQLRKEKGKIEFISDDRKAPTNSSSCSLTQLDSRSTQRNKKLKTDLSVMNFIYGNNLTSHLLKDPKFKEMCVSIADAGQGYEPPSFGMDETKMLGDLKTEVDGYVQSIKQSWEKFGCTLLLVSSFFSYDWPRGLILLAACPEGIVYLDSIKYDEGTAGMLSVIDKIIPQNTIQIILDREYERLYEDLQKKYPNIFKTRGDPYFAHIIDVEHCSEFTHFLTEVCAIVEFFDEHVNVLHQISGCQSMNELPFHHSLYSVSKEREIRSMVTSTEWRDLIQGDEQGEEVQKIIDDNQFWETGKNLFRVIECVVKIFWMMTRNRSTLGYIYAAFIRLEETVKQSFKGDSDTVQYILDGIQIYWQINEMQKAAAYLNPHLYFNGYVKMNNADKMSLKDAVQRMIPSEADKKDLDVQIENYYCRDPTIFNPEAVGSLHVLHPRIWWERWGGNAKILQTLAIKLLSQPGINPLFNTNLITLLRDNFHYDQRNELSLDVRINMRLMDMCSQIKVDESPIDFEKIGVQVADIIEAFS
ncbi:hypothetical protein QJS10_CPB14g00409 [Acorus calamus]|uniref:BED-type domain-containing protein n=1 Tax=Acorus calamus TaxID=4465 RepID=A0AAV9DDT5_ACOCL|nr:hypothetical protein QJS10_CPB14g00409 [Acorus calamus]